VFTDPADVDKVLGCPQLLANCDADAILKETGIHTTEKHLKRLVTNMCNKVMSEVPLKAAGAQKLQKGLQNTASSDVPTDTKCHKPFQPPSGVGTSRVPQPDVTTQQQPWGLHFSTLYLSPYSLPPAQTPLKKPKTNARKCQDYRISEKGKAAERKRNQKRKEQRQLQDVGCKRKNADKSVETDLKKSKPSSSSLS